MVEKERENLNEDQIIKINEMVTEYTDPEKQRTKSTIQLRLSHQENLESLKSTISTFSKENAQKQAMQREQTQMQ